MNVFHGPLAPKLRDHETAASFVSRLAAWLRYPSVKLFCVDFGLNFDLVSAGAAAQLEALAQLTGASLEELRRGPMRSGSMFSISGQPLATVYLDRMSLWICPHCAAEDIAAAPYLSHEAAIAVRRDNVIRAVSSCSRHHCNLVFVGRNELRHTRYDTSLATMDIPGQLPQLIAAAKPVIPSLADQFIWRSLNGEPSSIPVLADMPLNQVLKIAGRFGNWAQTGDKENLRKLPRMRFNETLSAGLSLLAGGREAVTEVLNRQLSEADFFNAAPVGQAVSKIRLLLFHARTAEPSFLGVQQLLNDAVAHCAYIKHSKETGENRWTALTALSPELGHAPYILQCFAEHAGAQHPTKPRWANKQALVEWMNRDGGLVQAPQAAADAGMSYFEMKTLLQHGRLSVVVPSRGTKGSYPWIRQGQVNAMLERILGNAEKVTTVAPGMTNVLGMVKRTHRTFLTFHDALISGELKVQSLAGKKPYASILVDIGQVIDRFETEYLREPAAEDNLLTAAEFAAATGVGIASVRLLSEPGGLIRTVQKLYPGTQRKTQMIPLEELERVRHTYIKLIDVAARLKVHPREVRGRLLSKGIFPIDSGRAPITFFLKSEMAKL